MIFSFQFYLESRIKIKEPTLAVQIVPPLCKGGWGIRSFDGFSFFK